MKMTVGYLIKQLTEFPMDSKVIFTAIINKSEIHNPDLDHIPVWSDDFVVKEYETNIKTDKGVNFVIKPDTLPF